MALDYANERYVRLYTRDTTTWKVLDWRARTVLMHMFRRVDRQGVLPVGARGTRGLAALLELPLDLVNDGITQLIEEEVVVKTEAAFVLPNFLEAQEAVQSTGHRSREYRERRRAAVLETVTKRDASITKRDDCVTECDEKSRGVTERHRASQSVTPILSEPSLTKRRATASQIAIPGSEPEAPLPPEPQKHQPAVDAFDAYFREATGKGAHWDRVTIAQMKTLVKKRGLEDVLERITILHLTPPSWPPGAWDLGTFVRHFDKCIGPKRPRTRAPTPDAPPSFGPDLFGDVA